MPLIGEFEVAARQVDPEREPDQFKLRGELFTVTEADLTVAFGRFWEKAQRVEKDAPEAIAAMVRMLKACVIPEDRERLVDAAEGLDPETLMRIIAAVIEVTTGRPTVRPSGSSAGPSRIGANSRASSPLGQVPPILRDPRVQALEPVDQAALSLVG